MLLGIRNETYIEDRIKTRRNVSPISSAEQHRVRQMVDRLESSSSSNNKTTKKSSTKKSFHDDHTDGLTNLTSAPSVHRVIRRETYDNDFTNGSNGGFVFRHKSPHEEIYIRDNQANVTRFELDRDEIRNGGRRTTSGTTVSYFSNEKQRPFCSGFF